jgi:hypothetical protein
MRQVRKTATYKNCRMPQIPSRTEEAGSAVLWTTAAA